MPEFELEPTQETNAVTPVTYERVYLSDDMRARLNAIREQSPIAMLIQELSSNGAQCLIKQPTNFNYLGVSIDDPTKISYLTYDRVDTAREKFEHNRIWEDKNYRYHSSAGKVIRKLLQTIQVFEGIHGNDRDVNRSIQEVCSRYALTLPTGMFNLSQMFTEAQFDQFNNYFRTEGFRQGDVGEVVFVKGHWIAELYLEKNYASVSGTLGNSCMRYERTNNFLDIYVKNPSVCQLAVLFNQEGKVQGRSIIWTVDGQQYYDRIYYTSDLIHDRMKAFFLVKNIPTCCPMYSSYSKITIHEDTTNADFDKRVLLQHRYYPYMDSMKYLDEERSFLTNDECKVDYDYLILNDTAGSYEQSNRSMTTCECCGNEVEQDDMCHIDIRRDDNYGSDFCHSCAVYSEHHSGYITLADSIYIEGISDHVISEAAVQDYDGNYILLNDAVILVDGSYAHQDDDGLMEYDSGGYFLLDSTNYESVEYDGLYYKVEDCVETKDGELVPENITTEHDGEVWITTQLTEHLNLNLI